MYTRFEDSISNLRFEANNLSQW